MLKEEYEITITGGHKKRFDHYPVQYEIEEFIKEYYPSGFAYYPIKPNSNLYKSVYYNIENSYVIEAKIDKVYTYLPEVGKNFWDERSEHK